ncbi:TolC family protein [Candidatus Palauibacter sp.]|uniref:TolC family protein n=1 Tax=Candidatus Palauibacter sp. TaxID=3101350 RepID=UPI003B528B9F
MRFGVGGCRPEFRGALAIVVLLMAGGLPVASQAAAQGPPLPDTLDIARAVRIAMSESPVLRGSRAAADGAGADRLAAWGAFLPDASVSLSLGRSNSTVSTYEAQEGPAERLQERLTYTSQSASQGLNLNLTLLDGGRRFAEIRRSAANLRGAQRRYDDQQRAVVAAVRREFLEALRRQELLELTRTQIADRELELEIASRRYEIAAVERTDVLGAELNLVDARIRLIAEQNLLRVGLRQLVVSMGLPPKAGEGLFLAGDEGMPAGIPDIETIVGAAVTTDPGLAALEADRSAASASLWSARTTYLPRITATLGLNRGENFGSDASFWQFDPSDTNTRFGISASWSIFDGFGREQQNAQASAAKRQAEEDYRRLRLEIERDVRRFGAQIEELAQTQELREQAYEISSERLEMEQERYRFGTTSFIELQNAIDAVQRAETALTQNRYDYRIAWSNLAEYVEGRP